MAITSGPHLLKRNPMPPTTDRCTGPHNRSGKRHVVCHCEQEHLPPCLARNCTPGHPPIPTAAIKSGVGLLVGTSGLTH